MSQYGPPPSPYGEGDDRAPYGGTGATATPGKGMAVTALVLGVLALLLSWTVIGGILLGLPALILGLIASSKAKKGTAGGRGLAIGGWITGLLGLLVAIALIALGGVFVARFLDSESGRELQSCLEEAGSNQDAADECQRQFEDNVEDDLSGQ